MQQLAIKIREWRENVCIIVISKLESEINKKAIKLSIYERTELKIAS